MTNENSTSGKSADEWSLSISGGGPIQAGRAVEITFTFRNQGASPVGFPRVWLWSDFEITMLDKGGHAAKLTLFGEDVERRRAVGGSAGLVTVAPGAQFAQTLVVSRLYDMSMTGRYTMEASKHLMNRAGDAPVKLTSNKIAIDVEE